MEATHGRPTNTWVRHVELDTGMTADAAWSAAADRDMWRALRPTAEPLRVILGHLLFFNSGSSAFEGNSESSWPIF